MIEPTKKQGRRKKDNIINNVRYKEIQQHTETANTISAPQQKSHGEIHPYSTTSSTIKSKVKDNIRTTIGER